MVGRYRALCLCCLLRVFAPSLAVSQETGKPADDAANLALARRLLSAMHYDETFVIGVQLAIREHKRSAQIPEAFYDSLPLRMKRATPQLLDSLAPGYARRFTAAQLRATLAFYESPAGQTLAREQAGLNVEALEFGKRWMAQVTRALLRDLGAPGNDLTNP
jgi:hypothetical protein